LSLVKYLVLHADVQGHLFFFDYHSMEAHNQIIIIIIIIIRTMFMMLSSWLRVIARVRPVHAMNAEQCQTAADLWSNPTDLSYRWLGNYIYHRHYSAQKLILILPSRRG